MRLLARLDAYGTDDPDFRESHPEDRCPVCPAPVVDHPCWVHRRAALVDLFCEWLDRKLARIEQHMHWHM